MDKNRLQEIYQKEGMPLPQYETTNALSDGIGFRSTVTVQYMGKMLAITGDICRNKKEAEQSAASKAYTRITGQPERVPVSIAPKLKLNIPDGIKIWIDSDSAQIAKLIEQEFPTDAISFVCAKGTANSHYKHPSIKVLDSAERDVVDYYIAFRVKEYLEGRPNRKAIVVTKDKFIKAVQYCLKEFSIKGELLWFTDLHEAIRLFCTP